MKYFLILYDPYTHRYSREIAALEKHEEFDLRMSTKRLIIKRKLN